MNKRFGLLPPILTVMALSIMLSACSAINATPINEINNFPANFDGKEVMLHGIATNLTRLPLLKEPLNKFAPSALLVKSG